ncbi:acyltransferase [Arenibacter arenosicollis]
MKRLLKILDLLALHYRLKTHGVVYGEKLRGNSIALKNVGNIRLGNKVSLNSYPDGDIYKTGLLTYFKESLIVIGDNCNLNGTIIHCNTKVTIGSHCMFGPGTKIVDNDSHRISIDINERRKAPKSNPIIIEDNVWIGMNSLVLKGVCIGKNSIVAAHSVVTKNVPENVLVGGNPAKIIKTLTK